MSVWDAHDRLQDITGMLSILDMELVDAWFWVERYHSALGGAQDNSITYQERADYWLDQAAQVEQAMDFLYVARRMAIDSLADILCT
jgi:hypothetical protein